MKIIGLLGVMTALAVQPALGQAALAQADGDPAAGQTRYAVNCISCHGRTGKGVAEFPSLIGRDRGYIANRLTQYRGKTEVGPNSAVMWSMAEELSDATIADVAAYVSATFK